MFGTTVVYSKKFSDTKVIISSNKIGMPDEEFKKIKETIEMHHKPNVMKTSKNGDFYFEGACPANIPDL